MEFTTHFGLHSQASRLSGKILSRTPYRVKDGALTLSGTQFQERISTRGIQDQSYRLQFRRFRLELFPVHSPLLGESWLVSFPPLSDMLKFSG